ncbi:DUF1016 family protein [Pseudoduganella sp. FT26W]|uniref:DUF1016 family protein n=1 Tax=Duganella aquatilis TaxID=2666082 RepID=A0A844DBL3_9BURK|nr:DUF1016 family protein [Duganella aquatilis]
MEALAGERASYGAQLMISLGQKLEREFGRGFEVQTLRRMVQFAQAFSNLEIVASLMRQLSWPHFYSSYQLKRRPLVIIMPTGASRKAGACASFVGRLIVKATNEARYPALKIRPRRMPRRRRFSKIRTFWTFSALAKAMTKPTWKRRS